MGFDPVVLAERLAHGHVGIAGRRMRVESAGGAFVLTTAPDEGTEVLVRLPG